MSNMSVTTAFTPLSHCRVTLVRMMFVFSIYTALLFEFFGRFEHSVENEFSFILNILSLANDSANQIEMMLVYLEMISNNKRSTS